jgi:hypothetical protein
MHVFISVFMYAGAPYQTKTHSGVHVSLIHAYRIQKRLHRCCIQLLFTISKTIHPDARNMRKQIRIEALYHLKIT